MEIPVYRGEDKLFTKNAPGKWWSPDSNTAENYAEFRDRYKKGLKKINPSKIMKGSIDIDDYKKGIQRSMLKHGEDSVNKRYGKNLQEAFKQVDIDVENLKKGKMSPKSFTTKYWETLLPDSKIVNPKLDILKTFKPIGKSALKQMIKFAGPLSVGYGVYDYLKGSPAGEGSQLDNTIDYNTMVYTDGPLANKKR